MEHVQEQENDAHDQNDENADFEGEQLNKEEEKGEAPKEGEVNEFDALAKPLEIGPGIAFVDKEMHDYLATHTKSDVLLELYRQQLGPGAVKFLEIIIESGNLAMVAEALKIMVEQQESVVKSIKVRFDFSGDDVIVKDSAPGIINMETYNTKLLMDKSSVAQNHFTYDIPGDFVAELGGPSAKLSPSKVVQMGLPDLVLKSQGEVRTLSGAGMSISLMVYVNHYTSTKGGGNVVVPTTRNVSSELFAEWYGTFAFHKLETAAMSIESYQKIVDRFRVQFLVDHPKCNDMLHLKPHSKVADIEYYAQFMRSKIGVRFLGMLTIDAKMRDYDFLKELAKKEQLFRDKDLVAARAFRKLGLLGQVAKEPMNVYSLKYRGLSVPQKFLDALLEISPLCGSAWAFGHSHTNNWEAALNGFGIVLVKGNILTWTLEKLENSYPTKRKVAKLPERKKVEGLDQHDAVYVQKFKTEIGNQPLIVSDVYLPVEDEEADDGSQKKLGKNYEKMNEYCAHLKKFLDAGAMVLAKFVPKKTAETGTTVVWDWELYWTQYFMKVYVRPFFQARMHNGEVLLAMSAKEVPGWECYTGVQWMQLSRIMQHRMKWGNAARNFLLAMGIPVINAKPALTVFALRYLTDSIRKEFEQTGKAVSSVDMTEEEVAVNINRSLKETEKKLALKRENKAIADERKKTDAGVGKVALKSQRIMEMPISRNDKSLLALLKNKK